MIVDRPECDWEGSVLQGEPARWTYRLNADERREAHVALEVAAQSRWSPAEAALPDFSWEALARASKRWRTTLSSGLGFVLVKGIPIAGHPEKALREFYAALGQMLGSAVPQNVAGDLICDIRDAGADPLNPNTRLYTTRAEQDFHTDGADIIGLLCLRPARSGGISRIVSSVAVLREFERRCPDLAPLLYQSWPFHNHGQGSASHFMMPIVRAHETGVSSFFIGWYIRRSQELADAPQLTPQQHEALALYESIANEPRFYLDMDFEPGDIQWLKNSVILHKRTEYEDWPEQARKRHLLRLWLSARDFKDGDERLRQGVVAPSS